MNELKIAHLNIFCRPTKIWQDKQIERSKIIPHILCKQYDNDLDIVILYEIFDTQCQQIVANEFTNLGLSHITYPYQAEFPAMTNSGIMVFSKHKCLSRKQEIYNHKTGVENLASKGILICQFSIHNKIINVLATHLSANILDREHQGEVFSNENRLMLYNNLDQITSLFKLSDFTFHNP